MAALLQARADVWVNQEISLKLVSWEEEKGFGLWNLFKVLYRLLNHVYVWAGEHGP